MKILFLMPSRARGGCEEFALTAARAALQRKQEVVLAFPNLPETQSLIDDCKKAGIDYVPLRQRNTSSPLRLLTLFLLALNFASALRLFLRINPDSIHLSLPWPTMGYEMIIAAAWLRIRTVVVFQLAPQKIAIGSLKLKTYRWAHNRSQQWAAVSKHNQASLCRTFGLAPKEVAVIYNGVSLPQAAAAETAKTKLREELGVLPDEAMVLTIARLDPLKGHEILVPAIAKIVKKHPRVKFFWIGDGTLRSALQNLVVSYGLLGKVVFSGFRTDVADLLDAAQLFVHPSEREGFSFAILEAMAHKVPIVAADSTSIPEVIENQVHGLLFRSGDSCDLLEKIDWALSNNQAMQEMAERAYVHVMKFPEKEMIEHHLHFLQRHELAQTTS